MTQVWHDSMLVNPVQARVTFGDAWVELNAPWATLDPLREPSFHSVFRMPIEWLLPYRKLFALAMIVKL